MKSKLVKSIAAILALASAGAANAAITTGQFGAPGELFLTVWDPTVGNEASFNIGLSLTTATFDGNGSYTFNNIFADPVFVQYFGPSSAGGNNLTNQAAWQWNVVAAQDASPSNLFTTVQGVASPLINNSGVDTAASNTTVYQLALGSACDSCGTDNALSPKLASSSWGPDFNGSLQLVDNATGIGSSLNFYRMSNSDEFDAGALATVAQQAYTWTLSAAGTLTYGPQTVVPVPAALWLLGSGLLGLVGIGRRRTAVAA